MTSTEYAVMIGLIIVFCSSSISFLGGETDSLFQSFDLAGQDGTSQTAGQSDATGSNDSAPAPETVAANDQQNTDPEEESQTESDSSNNATSFRARMSYIRTFLAWYFS